MGCGAIRGLFAPFLVILNIFFIFSKIRNIWKMHRGMV